MQKDLKIGMLLGLVLIAVAALWLATRPALSTKARLLQVSRPTQPAQVQQNQPAPYRFHTRQQALPGAHHFTKPAPRAKPEKSTAQDFSVSKQARTPKSNTAPTVKIHIVEPGQTLSGIAQKYYGSANKWQKILDANRSRLKDANTLVPGMRLTIP